MRCAMPENAVVSHVASQVVPDSITSLWPVAAPVATYQLIDRILLTPLYDSAWELY